MMTPNPPAPHPLSVIMFNRIYPKSDINSFSKVPLCPNYVEKNKKRKTKIILVHGPQNWKIKIKEIDCLKKPSLVKDGVETDLLKRAQSITTKIF